MNPINIIGNSHNTPYETMKDNIITILIIIGIIVGLIMFTPLGLLIQWLDIPIISDFLDDFIGEPYCPGSELDCIREQDFGPGPF